MRQLVPILVIVLSLFAAGTASADDGLIFNGGGQPQPLSPDQNQRNQTKSAIALQYFAHIRAGGTLANFPIDPSVLEHALNNGQPFHPGGVSTYAYPAPYYSHVLAPSYQAQETNYYCGPASAWVALKYQGAGNNYFGATLIQSNLATSFWLNTSSSSGTPLGSNWTHTLNSWTDGSDAGWYTLQTYPTYADAADVASKVAFDIDNLFIPVMDVYMNATRGYLPGWSGYTEVWHYLPAMGYNRYGDYLDYVEVFQPVGLGPKYDVTKELWASIVKGYGIVW